MAEVRLNSTLDELLRAAQPSSGVMAPERTGRYIVTFHKHADLQTHRDVMSRAGLSLASTADFTGHAVDTTSLPASGALLLPTLNVAVVSGPPDQMTSLNSIAEGMSAAVSVRPEYFVYTSDPAYIQGYRDGVNDFSARLLTGEAPVREQQRRRPGGVQTATWGLLATKVDQSSKTGSGIKVAILDTGLDLDHPDFKGRSITSKSFIDGAPVQDGNSHGTHCTGTACGTATPASTPRYGIASESSIFTGKVLNDAGSGADGGILMGIDWAVTNGCQVISMSLGRAAVPDDPDPAYERAGERALDAGCLIIAAAGNDSNRPSDIQPVGSPANATTIMAVASVGEDLTVSFFSDAGLNPNGGEVNIAGPGENVFSTVPLPKRYGLKSGTSMATPHVAGIAALYAQVDTSLRGRALWKRLIASASRLTDMTADIGSGLVTAPVP